MLNRYRSLLVTPATKPQCLKAIEVEADIAITDLEDSITSNQKDAARLQALRSFSGPPFGVPRCLRINRPASEAGIKDLAALLDSVHAPETIHIPKVESPEHVLLVESALAEKHPEIRFCAIIETAKGLSQVSEIAQCSSKLDALIFGAGDFATDIQVNISWANLAFARHAIIVAAASARIKAIDSPCFDLQNFQQLEHECQMGRQMGFSGKIAIHPAQVKTINTVFSPDHHTIETARAIVSESARAEDNIFVVNGQMVGPPILHRARQLLEMYPEFKGACE